MDRWRVGDDLERIAQVLEAQFPDLCAIEMTVWLPQTEAVLEAVYRREA
jgi:hypothetical protein